MMYVDLDELESLFRHRWCWSARRPALAWFRRRDHMGSPDQPLKECVQQFVRTHGGQATNGPVRLLTHFRYFGFGMNPVSFYFCFDPAEQLGNVVAEVNNTPWGEQHCYLLKPEHFAATSESRERLKKAFHVSPFLPMDMQYQWQLSPPGDRLNLAITNFHQHTRTLAVSMSMTRRELSRQQLRRVLLRYPLLTVRVFAGIYWQALRLWRKRIPFFPHPNKHPRRPSPSPHLQPESGSD